jgi:hypothetical protein
MRAWRWRFFAQLPTPGYSTASFNWRTSETSFFIIGS